MKITEDMIHKDIRQDFRQMSFLPLVFSNRVLLKGFDALTRRMLVGKNIKSLDCNELRIPSRNDEYNIRVRIYRPRNHKGKLPAMLYNHGGGFITGCPENSHMHIERFIQTRPCVVIAPDYRKATTKPYPAALNDAYDTLIWAKENANDLGILNEKFMITGPSAGGGLTASISLLNRDRKDVDIAFQMPLYPMIDDTQPYDSERHMITAVWDSRSNKYGWDKYLGELKKDRLEIPAYAAPARNRDYNNLPPTITFVGDMEPFYWETLEYAKALKDVDIPVKFKVYEGCFHGFDMMPGDKSIVKDARDFTFDSYAEYYDKYILST